MVGLSPAVELEVAVAYREVHVVEVREILRQWMLGRQLRAIARSMGMDRKTVRRYVEAAEEVGVVRGDGEGALDDRVIGQVVELVRARGPGVHGATWRTCEEQRKQLESWVKEGLRLTKVQTLLERRSGVRVPYRTLHRFAVSELGFGRGRVTVRVDDGEPGGEVQVDFGRMGMLVERGSGRRGVVWGLIFTAVVSRHQFVWLTSRQTVEDVISGCEAAWEFFGGVFRVMVIDNLKAVIDRADPCAARVSVTFREYAQSRGFVVDATRVRRPDDKPRVERSVPYVRGSFFAGEDFGSLEEAQRAARRWCEEVAGLRIHGTTRRRPAEDFAIRERPHLLPAPEQPYDVPTWLDLKVHRDHHLRVGQALYSLPTSYIGETVQIRADEVTVKAYHRGEVVRVWARASPGERVTDPADYPPGRAVYATRDGAALEELAATAGTHVGCYAQRLLEGPLPWASMRQVYRLLGLVRKYGGGPVELACERALALDVVDVTRVRRMLDKALERGEVTLAPPPAKTGAAPRFLRPASDYRTVRHEGRDHERS